MATTYNVIAPVRIPLPAAVTGDHFTELQWQILFALVDAVLPPIVVESTMTDKQNQLKISQKRYEEAYDHLQNSMAGAPDLDKFKEYLRTRQSDNTRFVQNIKRTFDSVPEEPRKKLGGVLKLLGYLLSLFEKPENFHGADGDAEHEWVASC
jgi:hypothetical protein